MIEEPDERLRKEREAKMHAPDDLPLEAEPAGQDPGSSGVLPAFDALDKRLSHFDEVKVDAASTTMADCGSSGAETTGETTSSVSLDAPAMGEGDAPRPPDLALRKLSELAGQISPAKYEPVICGAVTELAQDTCHVTGLSSIARIDDIVSFDIGAEQVLGQVVRVNAETITVKPFSSLLKVRMGTPVRHEGALALYPHESWRGRIINALGQPIDNKGELAQSDSEASLNNDPPPPLARQRINERVWTGIKIIDVFTPLCRGQRIGIFAGSGIGKSTLLKMLAGAPDFDTAVIALVGERGREVREFLEDGLGRISDRTVAVVATSDESAMMRRLAPATALSIAESFRDQGQKVILIIDSITRFAHAARDAAMAAGEPPIARGYTPSVFSDMARLLERAGPGGERGGSITGVFSVLVDGDDHDEPIADTIRGTLDGHIVLERAIAEQGRYPAVDPLASISRLAEKVWSNDQRKLVHSLRGMISRYEDGRDLRMLGGYQAGSDTAADQAIMVVPRLYELLCQAPDAPATLDPYREIAEVLSPIIQG